jgi:hypothetical protein
MARSIGGRRRVKNAPVEGDPTLMERRADARKRPANSSAAEVARRTLKTPLNRITVSFLLK